MYYVNKFLFYPLSMGTRFFLSKSYLLDWLHNNGVVITKIEELGCGVPLIQFINNYFTEKIDLYKINPVTEGDYIINLTKVKQFLERKGIKLYMPIEKMIKLRMQDNLEVLQLFYTKIHNLNTNNNKQEIKNTNNFSLNSKIELSTVKLEDIKKNTEDNLLKEINQLRYELAKSKEINNNNNKDLEISQLKQKLESQANEFQIKINKYKVQYKKFEDEMNYYYTKLLCVEKMIKEEMDDSVLKNKLLNIFYND